MKNDLRKEFEVISKLDYKSLVQYLNEKYGNVKEPYFRTKTCKSKNKNIVRSMDGLEIHHIGEDRYPNLSDTQYALSAPWSEQEPDRLVYCNLIEHTLLHVLISEQKGAIQPYFNFKQKLVNDILSDYDFKRDWMKIVYNQMKDYKDLLIKLYKRIGADSLLNY